MATITSRNGVDVDRLVATVGAVQGDPNLAKFTFRARSSWETGGRNKGEIREFEHAGATTTARGQRRRARAAPMAVRTPCAFAS